MNCCHELCIVVAPINAWMSTIRNVAVQNEYLASRNSPRSKSGDSSFHSLLALKLVVEIFYVFVFQVILYTIILPFCSVFVHRSPQLLGAFLMRMLWFLSDS